MDKYEMPWAAELNMPFFGVLLAAAFLAYIVVQWKNRSKLFKLIDVYPCKLCDKPLDEALYDYLGKISRSEKKQLDKFQAQYAHCKIRCGNCGGVLICADNGTPMRGFYEEKTWN